MKEMKEMKDNKYHYRTKMIRMFLDLGVSVYKGSEIMHLFANIDESKKEALAKQICDIIETSQTEEEMVERAKALAKKEWDIIC